MSEAVVVGRNLYRCAACGNIYDKLWSDEEADTEYKRNFPDAYLAADEVDTICDDCYRRVMGMETRQ